MRHSLRHFYTLFDKDLNPVESYVDDPVEAYTNNDPDDWYNGKYTYSGNSGISPELQAFLKRAKEYTALLVGKIIVTPDPEDSSRIRFRVLSSYTAGKLTEEQRDNVISRGKRNIAERYAPPFEPEPESKPESRDLVQELADGATVQELPTCGHEPLKYIATDSDTKDAIKVVCEQCARTYEDGCVVYTAHNGSLIIATADLETGLPKRYIMVSLDRVETAVLTPGGTA